MQWRGVLYWCLTTAAGMLLAQQAWATIYRWVDRQGQVHYGDQPDRNEAVQIEVVEPQSFVLPAFQEPQPQQEEGEKEQQRHTVTILSPKPGAALTTGTVTVRYSIKPPLEPGQGSIIAYLDGAEVARPRGTVFAVEILQEGAHELRLQVLDAKGEPLAQTAVLVNVRSPFSEAGSSNFELLKKLPPPRPQATPRLFAPAQP